MCVCGGGEGRSVQAEETHDVCVALYAAKAVCGKCEGREGVCMGVGGMGVGWVRVGVWGWVCGGVQVEETRDVCMALCVMSVGEDVGGVWVGGCVRMSKLRRLMRFT